VNPIDIVQFVLLAAALAVAIVGAVRKHNHVEANALAERDMALAENKRLLEENARLADELHAAKALVSPELLLSYARIGVAYAEKLGGTPAQKLEHAANVVRQKDAADNGVRNWPDNDIRVAIEAVLSEQP
jgi:hypothetical protein